MKDESKTKKELIGELQSLKRQNTRLKKKLKETEEEKELFFENSLMPTFITTLDGKKVVDANVQAVKLAGYASKEEFLKEFVTGEGNADSHAKENLFSALQSRGEVSKKEFRFFKKDGRDIWVEFNARRYSPKGWLIVEVVDFTKHKQLENILKKAQRDLKKTITKRTAELEQTRDFMENIFNTSVEGIMVVDAQGYITRVNPAMAELLGYSESELVGKSAVIIRAEGKEHEEHGKKFVEALFEKGYVREMERRWKKKDGTLIDVEINAALLRDGEGNHIGGVGSYKDITMRKQAEQELRETNEFLESIFKASVDGIIVADKQGQITMVNDAVVELFGYSRDELVGMHTGELTVQGEAYRPEGEEIVGQLLEEGYASGSVKWLKKDGSPVDIEMNMSLLPGGDGNFEGAVGVIRDITGRKQAEEELRETKEFLESIFKASVDGIIVADKQGQITMVNDAVVELFGYSRDELMEMRTEELAIDDEVYRKEGAKIIERLFKEGTVSGIERRWSKKDGSVVDYEMNISLITNEEGSYEGGVGIVRDISERKRVEKALQKSEVKYRELVENANSVILRMDLEGKVTFFNAFAQRFFGFTEEEIIGKNVVGTIVPERDSTGRDLVSMIRDVGIHPEKYIVNENENMRSNGERVWMAWTNNVVVNQENNAEELLCFGNDITERRHAEETLRETKDFLDNIIESSLDAIVIADTKGYITRANSSFLKLLGYGDGTQVMGRHLMEFAPQQKGIYESTTGYPIEIGDDFFENTKEWMSQLTRAGKLSTLETFHINNDNKLIPVEDTVNYIYTSEGERLGTVGIIRDITERKQAEKVLQRQKHDLEERFKELTVLFNISKLCQDRNITLEDILQGIVNVIPQAWQYPGITCARLTFEDQEFSTKSFRETPWQQSTDVVVSGEKAGVVEVFYLEERPERYKGPFLKEEENLIEAIAREIGNAIVIRQAEERIIKYQDQLRSLSSQLTLIEERERRKFATYIHDQIGQALFSAKIQLEALGGALPHEDGKQSVNKIGALLEQVIKDSRDLTFEVGAPILYQLGIEAALERLVEKINKDGKFKATYRSDEKVKSLDEDVSIFLLRAVQELITNIVKHAHAKNVEVSICREDAKTCVSVKDDGIGFNFAEVDPITAGDYRFGLFSVKERLVHLGGILSVESTLGKGTCITLVVP